MKFILSLLVLFLTFEAFADQPLTALVASPFQDQHGETQQLDEKVKWVIFASDMDAFKMAKEAFETLEIKSATEKNGLLVSDISGMPSLVTKLFALPKMKKYTFKVALDREGTTTKDWPREKGKLSLLKIENLEVKQISQLSSTTDVISFLKEN